jgi:hypothetical protein
VVGVVAVVAQAAATQVALVALLMALAAVADQALMQTAARPVRVPMGRRASLSSPTFR